MRNVLMIGMLALAACSDPIEKEYNARLDEAKAHCLAKGGDEFKPYGANAWMAVAKLQKPATFRCQRLEKNWKRGIAVYALTRVDNRIALEIR